MNFLDWIKKYKVAISFLLGLLTGMIGSYYKFQSRLDTIDFKLELIQQESKREYDNIYDVLHQQKTHIDEAKNQLQTKH